MRKFQGNGKYRILISAALMTFVLGLTGCGSLNSIDLTGSNGNEIEEDDKYQLIEKYIDKYYLYDADEEKEKEAMYRALLDGLDDP